MYSVQSMFFVASSPGSTHSPPWVEPGDEAMFCRGCTNEYTQVQSLAMSQIFSLFMYCVLSTVIIITISHFFLKQIPALQEQLKHLQTEQYVHVYILYYIILVNCVIVTLIIHLLKNTHVHIHYL